MSITNKLRLWLERRVATFHYYLARRRRPSLHLGDYVSVLLHDRTLPDGGFWILHEFVKWSDAPRKCYACGATSIPPLMSVRSLDGQKRTIILSYNRSDPTYPDWRRISLPHPRRRFFRRSPDRTITKHGT